MIVLYRLDKISIVLRKKVKDLEGIEGKVEKF